MMMIYHRKNFSSELPEARAGDIFVECNFAQAAPGTAILAGVKSLSFVRCNLARAVVPDDARVDDCNTSQEPVPPEDPSVRMYEIEEPTLRALVYMAEKGGMDVGAIRDKYDLTTVVELKDGKV